MPIRSLVSLDNTIAFTDANGLSRTVTAAGIPAANKTTPAAAEAWLNANLSPLTDGSYQIVAHVFTVTPVLSVALLVLTPGDPIPTKWWGGP